MNNFIVYINEIEIESSGIQFSREGNLQINYNINLENKDVVYLLRKLTLARQAVTLRIPSKNINTEIQLHSVTRYGEPICGDVMVDPKNVVYVKAAINFDISDEQREVFRLCIDNE